MAVVGKRPPLTSLYIKLGRRQRQLLAVLYLRESLFNNTVTTKELIMDAACMEAETNGISANDAKSYLSTYEGFWRTDSYLSLGRLIEYGLVERVRVGEYKITKKGVHHYEDRIDSRAWQKCK